MTDRSLPFLPIYLLVLALGINCSLLAQADQVVILPEFRDEIKQLGADPRMVKAFEYIQAEDSLTLTVHIDLTEIEAPPFAEEGRAEYFMKLLGEAGADSVWLDSIGNVIALRHGVGGQRRVVLDAHLDTVFPKGTDVKVRFKADTLFAPGIGDDTRGLAMVYTILRTMAAHNLRTQDDIWFVGTVGEEGLGDLRGVKHLFRPGAPKIDAWISIDGGRIGRVNNMALGSYRYRVTFSGPGGHSWGAFGLVNPHHALGSAINEFVQLADDYTRSGPKTSYNVGRVGGGTSINSVPFSSWMEIDMRSVEPTRLDSMEKLLEHSVTLAVDQQNQIKRLGADLTASIDKIGDRPSGELSLEEPLIQRTLAATAFFGKIPRPTRGSTNSNTPISLGVPAVTIGRGGVGAYAHSLDEWWINRDGYQAIQLAFLLLVSEAGLQ